MKLNEMRKCSLILLGVIFSVSLNDLLGENKYTGVKHIEDEITKERIVKHLDDYRDIISYWRLYPDKFIDYLCSLNPDNTFHFFFYQRVFLRAIMRHRYVYATFVRAWSKSFMSVMGLMIKATLYPGAKLFTVAGGKEQSAGILSSKVEEICKLIPAFAKEIEWDTRGTNAKTRQTKDTVVYQFKNGSTLENIAASEKTRGRRFQAGLMEECVGIDQDVLNEIIVPTMNVSRMINGQVDPNERLNKSQIYVTTAGYKNSFSYEKLLQIFCQSVAKPKDAIILGGSWRVPVVEGLLSKDFVRELKLDGTFNEASFDREYESKWTGDVESAFFDSQRFEKYRVLNMAEYEHSNKIGKNGYYVMGVDVGRFECTTEVVILKVSLLSRGTWIKQLVNIYTIEAENFIIQTIKLKKIYEKFKCKCVVVDGNGVGAGLVDLLVCDTIDPDTGDTMYGWGVVNDEDRKYKNMETENTIRDLLYIMKANQALNSEMYAYCKNQITNGRMRFLIDENVAKNKLLAQSQGQKMTALQRADYLMPYSQTSILRDQMMNLIQENEGTNIILKQSNKKIKKDKFSALIYALYFCSLEEDKERKHKTRKIEDFMFFTKH